MQTQKVHTDAGARFSRGVHPSQALLGVERGIELMRLVGGGEVARGIVDEYPRPVETVHVELPVSEIRRIMGIDFSVERRLTRCVVSSRGRSEWRHAPYHPRPTIAWISAPA